MKPTRVLTTLASLGCLYATFSALVSSDRVLSVVDDLGCWVLDRTVDYLEGKGIYL